MLSSTILLVSALVHGLSASPTQRRQAASQQAVVTESTWDGSCFYPVPDDDFELTEYLGRWYQVAGTVAPFTAGCKCVYAEYSLNSNGTVRVFNSCELAGREIRIEGTATAVDEKAGYGEGGILRVQFPGLPAPECPGPNYIVQRIEQDDDEDDNEGSFAIVQASNFTTLFLLSRDQSPPSSQIDRWLNRAGRLGSDMSKVVRTNQTQCSFT